MYNAMTAAIATFFVAMGGWMSPSQEKTFTTYAYVSNVQFPEPARVGQKLVIEVSGVMPQAGLTLRGVEFTEQPQSKTILIKVVVTGEKDKAYADMLTPYTATGSFTPKTAGTFAFTAMNPNGEISPLEHQMKISP